MEEIFFMTLSIRGEKDLETFKAGKNWINGLIGAIGIEGGEWEEEVKGKMGAIVELLE